MYDWLKALHVIAIIAWMAGMLYLPRLFVYHAEAAAGSDKSETFKVMERRLLTYIATPAMVVSLVVGFIIAIQGGWFKSGWFHAKLLLVVLLIGVHGVLAVNVRRFAEDRNIRPAGYFRILNEVPTLLMMAIVVLVVVKPF